MGKTKDDPETAGQLQNSSRPDAGTGQARTGSTMSKSMHDGVEVWCDCCSCEAEPYWVEAMQEPDRGS